MITPDTVILPVLVVPKVIGKVFVIPPVIVKVLVPALTSVLILEAVAVVIVPDIVAALAPVINRIAPVPPTPVPFNVMASEILAAPLISIAVPSAIMVPWEPV